MPNEQNPKEKWKKINTDPQVIKILELANKHFRMEINNIFKRTEEKRKL